MTRKLSLIGDTSNVSTVDYSYKENENENEFTTTSKYVSYGNVTNSLYLIY